MQELQHAVLAIALAVAVLDDAAEILCRPGAHPIPLDVRPAQDEGPEGRHLPFAQSRRATRVRPIAQPVDAFFIKPMHPIPEALAIHPSKPGRIRPARPVQHRRQGQHPPRRATVRLDLGTLTKCRRRNVLANRHGAGHGRILCFPTIEPPSAYFTSRVSQNIAGLVLKKPPPPPKSCADALVPPTVAIATTAATRSVFLTMRLPSAECVRIKPSISAGGKQKNCVATTP